MIRLPDAARVYLVRHGQSEWNVRRLTQGQVAHPRLTDLGRGQATAAARVVLADLARRQGRLDRLVTSDLVRAAETAAIIGAAAGILVTRDPRLREQHLGRLEGLPYAESWAAAEQHDWSDPTAPVAGGESVADLHARIAAVLAGLGQGSTTVLVSHGDAIRAALAQVDGVDPLAAPWQDVPNGAVFGLTAPRGWERVVEKIHV